MATDGAAEHASTFFGEPFAFETLGAPTVEDHCLTVRGELQGLRSAIEARRQRRASAATVPRTSDDAAIEQQTFRAELVQDFEKRLADMHVQLVAKQHEFEAYRQTMEHDLKQQLRAAQPHLVTQLVDKSGAMSVETKTSFLESLHGQTELEHLRKENVAYKQTLLKLQTLYEMQRQLRDVESEKERAIQKAQRLRAAQLVNENAELQQRIRALETEMLKVTQERTAFQTKYTELEKQNELAAQRRREAKVRALSAPYRRRLDGVEEPPRRDDGRVDYEQQQDAFETKHEILIRSPRPATTSSLDATTRDDEHVRSIVRHYQNDLKRLQQQLAKEIKLKTQLLDQVAQLKAEKTDAENDTIEQDEEPAVSVPKTPRSGNWSASPRVRAASASVCSPRKVPIVVAAPRRPSTSFSPRVLHHRTLVHSAASPRKQSPSKSASPSRSASASASSTRKFQVVERTPPITKVGGVAGVSNALSERERLPYR